MADDTSGLLALGQALDDYLVGEYSPTPGAQTVLGFLAGVPVNPATFQNGGVANPAQVQAFMNLVVNRVAPVVDGRCAGSLMPAHQLYAALLAVSTPLDPKSRDTFLALKTMAGSAFGILGPPKDVVTAPSNWYDPANAEGWSTFSTTTATTTTTTTSKDSGTGPTPSPKTLPEGETPPIVARERFEQLWQWRTPDPAAMAEVVMAAPAAVETAPDPVGETVLTGSLEIRPEVVVRDHRSAVGGPVVRDHRGEVAAVSVRDHRRASFRARAIAADTMAASPQLMMRALAAEPAVDEPVVAEAVTDAPVARVMATAPRLQLTDLVDAEPVLVTSEDTTVKSQAVAQLIEDQAPVLIAAVQQEEQTTSTQTVESHDLSLSLEYCFVQVSRDAWWNELFLTMPGWYAPGLKAGDFVPGRHLAGLAVGVPVAMLVTRNVRVSGHWSEADRAAASSHTSIGPWQMSESAMTVDEHEETTTLTMPGTQVVAVVCSLLPSLPPDDDPALAAAPPAEAATA